jgi:hypothetical protein
MITATIVDDEPGCCVSLVMLLFPRRVSTADLEAKQNVGDRTEGELPILN